MLVDVVRAAPLCSYPDGSTSATRVTSKPLDAEYSVITAVWVPNWPVGCQKSVTYGEQQFPAARSYSLIKPSSTG